MATQSSKRTLDVRAFRAEEMPLLLASSAPPCVSVYLSTSRRFPENS